MINDGCFGAIEQVVYMESLFIPGLIAEFLDKNDNTRIYFDGVRDMLAATEPGRLIQGFHFSRKSPITLKSLA